MVDVNVYVGKPMIRGDGAEGWKYEVTVYPTPPNHKRIANLITNIIKDALE